MRKYGLLLVVLLVFPMVSVHAVPRSSKIARAAVVTPSPPVPVIAATPIPIANEQPIRVLQTEPVKFTIPSIVWLAWIISIGSAAGAVAVIWRFIVSAAKIIANIATYQSVLLDIAHEFKADSGSTLKDAIDRLEAAAHKAQATAETAQKTADSLAQFLREHITRINRTNAVE